jgi:hypothetical protein
MSAFEDPFNPQVKLGQGCGCGLHADTAAHDAEVARRSSDPEALAIRAVDQAVMRALFPQDGARRRFLRAVGANTALAAVAQFFPLAAAREAFAQGAGKIEKPNLKVGFIPIPYTTPAIENINGQAITLAIKHKDKRDPKQWKGFKFAVPFDYSILDLSLARLTKLVTFPE